MEYNSTVAAWSYWQLTFPVFIGSFALAMIVLAGAPPSSPPALRQSNVRLGMALTAFLLLAVAGGMALQIYERTILCSASAAPKQPINVVGTLHILGSGKFMQLQVGEHHFVTSSAYVASECGLRASLGQSVSLSEGAIVEVFADGATIKRLRVLP